MVLGKRGIIYLALCAISFVLAIVATPLAFAYIETDRTINGVTGHSEVKYTMWRVCAYQRTVRNGAVTSSESCSTDFDCATDAARAAQAFSILALGFLALFCCVLGVADVLCKLPADPVGKLMLFSAAMFAAVCAVLSWVLQIALYTNACSGSSIQDADGSKMGPSPILMIVASIPAIIAVVVSLCVPGSVVVVETVSAGPVPMVNQAGLAGSPRPQNPVTRQPYVV